MGRPDLTPMADDAMECGLYTLPVADVWFSEPFDADHSPVKFNHRKPVIVIERAGCYQLLDGWNRMSGLVTAGAEEVLAICVSNADYAERAGGDDEEWNAEMWEKYTDWEYVGTDH